jgi:hypothetical protein
MSRILKVAVLSQNAVKSSPGLNLDLVTPDVDVYVEMTQEDSRKPDEKTIINSELLKGYTPTVQSLTKAQSGKNIVTKLFINDPSITVTESGHVNIGAGDKKSMIGYVKSSVQESGLANFTKGAVYIKIKKGDHSFLFINMHLPIDTGDKKTLGNRYRIASLYEIMKTLEGMRMIDNETTVLIGGDLNFRIVETKKFVIDKQKQRVMANYIEETINPHIPIDFEKYIHTEKTFMQDQLDTLLKEHNKGYYFDKNPLFTGLKELEFPNDKDKKFTCKFETGNKDEYVLLDKNLELEACRNRPFKMDKEYIEEVQRDCGVGNRTPSRCDRFLLMPVDKTVDYKVIRHTAVYLKEIASDHNCLECVVEFNSNDDIYDNSRLFEPPGISMRQNSRLSRRTSSKRTMRSQRRSSRNSASSNGDSFYSADSSISQSDKRPSRGGTKKRRRTKRKKQTKGRKQRR